MQKFLRVIDGTATFFIPVNQIKHIGIEGSEVWVFMNQVLLTGISNAGELATFDFTTGSSGEAELVSQHLMELVQDVLQQDWKKPSLEVNVSSFPATVTATARDQHIWNT